MEGQPAPWDVLLAERLPGMLAATAAQQLALKNGSTLAKAQRALGVAGDDLLSIQARCVLLPLLQPQRLRAGRVLAGHAAVLYCRAA